MRSFYARGVLFALGALGLIGTASGQYPNYGNPSLLPAPPVAQPSQWSQPAARPSYAPASYGGYRTNPGYYAISQGEPEQVASPSDQPLAPQPMYSPPPAYSGHAPAYGGHHVAPANPYSAAMQAPWDGAACASGACGPGYAMPSYGPSCGNWYAGAGGLLLTRDNANEKWLSYDSNDPSYHLLTSNHADVGFGGGFQTTIGRYFNCGCNAIEATYWGLFPGASYADVYESQLGGGMLNSTIPFDGLAYDRGGGYVPVASGFNDAARHRVTVRDEFHNVEVNILGFGVGACGTGGCGAGGCAMGACGGGRFGGHAAYGGGAGGCGPGGCGAANDCGSWGPGGAGCNRLRFAWLAGVRYFRFAENFEYASDLSNTTWNYDADEAFYRINVVNDLIGFQLGSRIDYCVRPRLSFHAAPKVGIYANQMSQMQHICNSIGYAVVDQPASPWNGDAYAIRSSDTSLAFLGELDIGATYRFSCCWSANVGYKAVAISGVALPVNQFPTYFSDLGAAQAIDDNGSLILHGLYAGLNFNW